MTDAVLTNAKRRIAPLNRPGTIVYGAFKGMGDLLSASSVIAALLNRGHKVKLLLFPGMTLEEFIRLIDFGPHVASLEILYLPVSGGPGAFCTFFAQAVRFRADLVWISPHAPREASSWKIPLVLWLTKLLCWPGAKLVGAESEPLSVLFGERIAVDRNLPIFQRENTAFALLCSDPSDASLPRVKFVERIRKHREDPPRYDLLIHPGANASNRSWPYGHYEEVIRLIPHECRVAVLGLPHDLEQMRRVLPADRGIQFISGSLEEALAAIACTRVVLAMDSGTAHFANFLNVPAVAIYGKSDPETIIGRTGTVLPIYEQKFPCQPCGRAVCSQDEVYCMNTIRPETVAAAVEKLLAQTCVSAK